MAKIKKGESDVSFTFHFSLLINTRLLFQGEDLEHPTLRHNRLLSLQAIYTGSWRL
jgi:hypothetical protein